MKHLTILAIVLAILTMAAFVIADNLVAPYADGDNLGKAGTSFGTAHIQGIASSITFNIFVGAAAATEVECPDGGTITNAGSYQPIWASAHCTSDTTTAIIDGVTVGDICILVNTSAFNIVIDDGANTLIGGNVTLGADADDSLMLLWDGSDWIGIGGHDN